MTEKRTVEMDLMKWDVQKPANKVISVHVL